MRLHFRQYPHRLLLSSAVLMAVSGWIVPEDTAAGLLLNDTSVVWALSEVLWLSAGLLTCIWTVYLLTWRILFSLRLSLVHAVITIVLLAGGILLLYVGDSTGGPWPRRYFDSDAETFLYGFPLRTKVLIFIVPLLLLSQLLLLTNIALGVSRRILGKWR